MKWNKFKYKCKYWNSSFNGDWVTCDHPENKTAIMVCSLKHCPRKEKYNGKCEET